MSARKNPRRSRGPRNALVLLLSLALVAAVLYGADHLLRARAESHLASELRQALPEVSDDLQVQIDGALFLPQLITGSGTSAQVSASELQIDAFSAHDTHVHLRGVHLREPYRVEYLQVDAVAPAQTLQALLAAAGVPDGVRIDLDGTDLTARSQLLGVPLAAVLIPEARGRSIAITVGTIELGGARIEAADLPDAMTGWLSDLQVELTDLPEPLLLDHLEVRPGGVALRVTGTDVAIEDL